ncbi:fructose-like specific PTS system EIIC component 2 [Escherichia coli]|uniref:Fructose-like specific PTS system EIIC component 2 n=1 Tax=Escherichia coli TaxID=562 RepID=A0A485JLZ3_ECOLX|nr:fructose-like specific PTS system EIIC component 2 [Escherichia coli]
MPIFIIPIVGTLITAGIMMWGLGEPVGALTNSLTQWLQGMQQGSIVMLAVIMGLMLAFDMGGPVNKVAYAFMLIALLRVFIPWWPLLPWGFVFRRWGWGWRR